MSEPCSSNRSRRLLIAGVVLIGLVSLVQPGCDCSSDGSFGSAPVASVFPEQGSETALISTDVIVFFGIDMNATSVESSFTLTESGGTDVSAVVVYDATTTTATLVPVTDLKSGTEYRATISSSVQDAAGNTPLSSDFVWSFTVSQAMELVSKDVNDVVGNNDSDFSDISSDGRYIVFESSATNLVPSFVTNGRNHIYWKDTVTDEVLLVSSDIGGLEANNSSTSAQISASGRFVVFESTATNLVTFIGNNTGLPQIYLKDMDLDTVVMISRNAADASNSGSGNPDISADGRFIVFESNSTNLTGLTSTVIRHIYLADTQTPNVFVLVSVDTNGIPTITGSSANPSISNDGRFIAFDSTANDLVAIDTNGVGVTDVFMRDIGNPPGTNPVTILISKNSAGTDSASGFSENPVISGDGLQVVFESDADDIDGGATGTVDIFLSNTIDPATLVTSFGGVGANGDSTNPSISDDGRYVAFESQATNLDGGSVSKFDIFVSDEATTDTIKRITLTSDDDSNNARISPDGRYVSFDSPFDFTLEKTGTGQVDIYRAQNTTF